MTGSVHVVVEPRGPYGPSVRRTDGHFVYEIYVASGHADRVELLPITEAHAQVLSIDPPALLVAVHRAAHPYQLTETRLGPEQLTYYLDTILFADPPVVERFLTDLDHGSANGALSNLLRIFLNADYAQLRSGRWFQAIRGH